MAKQIKFGDKLVLKGETLILDNGVDPGVIRSKSGTTWIKGDLLVTGSVDTINSTTLVVEDINIELGRITTATPTDALADGGGIILKGTTNKTILWANSTDTWDFNQKVKSINGFEGNLTGNSTGIHLGGLHTQGQDLISTGLSELNDVRIWLGSINDTTIGAITPTTGAFTDLTATTLTGALDYSNLINVPTIVNHSIDTLSDVDTTTTAPTNGQTILWNASTSQFLPGDTFSEVVEDTTPQLGGNLDLNTFDLSTTDSTVKLTTSSTSSDFESVTASTETNLSNTTVAFNDGGDYANAVSSYATLTSADIDILGFKGEASLTYFASAPSTSNFVWRDVSENIEQNSMVTVYAPPTSTYTFTLPNSSNPSSTLPINSLDTDIYFKQYAYGEFLITSATTLTTANTQLKDSNGFYIDSAHVTITNTSGNLYKIVFWTHDVTVGDVIEIFSPPEETVVFGWGGITTTGGRLKLLDTSGNLIYKLPVADGTANQVMKTDGSGDISWVTQTVGASYTAGTNVSISAGNVISATDTDTVYTDTDVASYLGGNLDTHILPDTNATYDIGSASYKIRDLYLSDNSLHIGANVLRTNSNKLLFNGEDVMDYANITSKPTTLAGYGITDATDTIYTSFNTDFDTILGTKSTTDLSEGTNLYYTDARADARAQLKVDALVGGASAAFDTLVEIQNAMATDSELTSAISGLNHDTLSGFVANEHIDWSTDQGATNIHANNYSNTNTGIIQVSDDTTPQLGGNLDLQTFDITTSSTDFALKTGTGSNITSVEMGSITASGLTMSGLGVTSPTNQGQDVVMVGDINYTSGIYTGEFIGMVSYDNATSRSGYFGLSTVTENSVAYVGNTMFSAEPQIILGNVGTSNAVTLAIGTGTTNRIHQLDASGNTIFKFPAADGTTSQVLTTDGSGDLSWTNTTNTTYTAGSGLTLTGTVFSNTSPDQTVSLTGTGATTISGTYPNFNITSTDTNTDTTYVYLSEFTNDTGFVTTDTTYTNLSEFTNDTGFVTTDTTYTSGTGISINGFNVISNTASAVDITGSIIPATDNTYDLGSTTHKYANIYGHSVEATFADLAERYASDAPYESGTVVVFGGEAEITLTSELKDVSVAGVISTNPALKLNADAGNSQTHPYVALRGRVPCMLIGPVSKGDLIVTADNEPGYAQSIGKNDAGRSVFAKSIETDLTEGKKLIEVVIL